MFVWTHDCFGVDSRHARQCVVFNGYIYTCVLEKVHVRARDL